MEADRKLLRDFLKQQSGLSAVSTEWGTASFPRLLSGNADAFLERLRTEFDTSAVPGRFFEMPDHFRIGMGVNAEMFAEGLNRIGRALACDACFATELQLFSIGRDSALRCPDAAARHPYHKKAKGAVALGRTRPKALAAVSVLVKVSASK